jgi:hypothetical protein
MKQKKFLTTEGTEGTEKVILIFLCDLCGLCGWHCSIRWLRFVSGSTGLETSTAQFMFRQTKTENPLAISQRVFCGFRSRNYFFFFNRVLMPP